MSGCIGCTEHMLTGYVKMQKRKIGGIKKKHNMLNDSCVILGYYAASSGNFLPTFQDNLRTGEQFPFNSLQKPDITQHAQPSTIFV
jgi:hypothetical protein